MDIEIDFDTVKLGESALSEAPERFDAYEKACSTQ